VKCKFRLLVWISTLSCDIVLVTDFHQILPVGSEMWLVPTSTFAVSKTNIKQIFNFRGVQIPISAVFRLRLVIGYKIQGCSGAGTRCDAVPTNILALRHIVGHRWNTNTEAFRQITSYSLGWPSISLFSGPNCPQTRDLASKISENFSGVTPRTPSAGGGDPLSHPPPARLHAVRGGASSPVVGT